MESSGSGSSGRQIPQWILEPPRGELILIAKKGEGTNFPDYVNEALSRYEEEQRAEEGEPGLEGSCANKCGSQTVF